MRWPRPCARSASPKQLVETQQVTLTLGGPEAERAFVSNQMQTWGKVVKDNNIKADQN